MILPSLIIIEIKARSYRDKSFRAYRAFLLATQEETKKKEATVPAGDVLLLVFIFLGRLGSGGRRVFLHYPLSSSLDCNSEEGRFIQEPEDSVITTKYIVAFKPVRNSYKLTFEAFPKA